MRTSDNNLMNKSFKAGELNLRPGDASHNSQVSKRSSRQIDEGEDSKSNQFNVTAEKINFNELSEKEDSDEEQNTEGTKSKPTVDEGEGQVCKPIKTHLDTPEETLNEDDFVEQVSASLLDINKNKSLPMPKPGESLNLLISPTHQAQKDLEIINPNEVNVNKDDD